MIKSETMKAINYRKCHCCLSCAFSETSVFDIGYCSIVCARLTEQVEKIEDAQVIATSVCDYYKEQQ